MATICLSAKRLSLRAQSGISPRRVQLPAAWINNAFLGWDGRATVLWSERGLALEIVADPPLSTYILYSPGGDSDFFCFEPVSHLIDAHNLPGGASASGLRILAPQEAMSVTCEFRPSDRPVV